MKRMLIKIAQWLMLLFSWLTLSPLFIYLARKWQLIGKKLSIFFMLLSPLMLAAYLVVFLFALQEYVDYQRKHKFANNEVIERITGIPFPELKIVDYHKGKDSFLGDYNDRLILQMEEELDESTYLRLDSIIQNGNTDWGMRENQYNYSRIWGNGFPAPEGQNDEEDVMFSLSFHKGSDTLTLNYGAW